MAIPTQARTTTSFIFRRRPTPEGSSPWEDIFFIYPVESDELSQALRDAYPQCSTLRERKHQAVIDFLSEELRQMKCKAPDPSPVFSNADLPQHAQRDDLSAFNDELSNSSRQHSTSTCTSPSVSSVRSSVIADRSARHAAFLMAYNAEPAVSTITKPTADPGASGKVNSAVAAQQFVFSAHDGRAMRPKTKRKMTLEERSAYKETRKRGACDKCRRQKGRCTHVNEGDTEMAVIEHVNKVAKRNLSTGFDRGAQEGVRPIKIELSPTVHVAHSTHNDPQPTNTVQQIDTNRALGPDNNGPLPQGDDGWESVEGYVQSEPNLDPLYMSGAQADEPWSPFSGRDPAEPYMSGYPEESSVARSAFLSPSMVTPPSASLTFQSGHPFYGSPWSNSQDQPMGGPAPT